MTATTVGLSTTSNIKKTKIIYWITTGLLALFILPGIFLINAPVAIEGTRHLGLPEWFRWELAIGNIIGGLLLILPVGRRPKEWAYVALGIVYISALTAHLSVDGFVLSSFAPAVTFAILLASYVYYRKLQNQQLYNNNRKTP